MGLTRSDSPRADLTNLLNAKAYDPELPLDDLPDAPEILIFGGEGEWVPSDFLQLAQAAGRQVARLRYSASSQDDAYTASVLALDGWLRPA
jgi:hypothetical protein